MNILSFDVEEWFHLLDHGETKNESEWRRYPCRIHENVDRILEMLSDYNQKATFFCLGWIARNYPEVIEKIDSAGHEVASHSDRHQLAYEQTPDQFGADLSTSIYEISEIIGQPVDTYRIPGFSLTVDNQDWVFEKLLEAGITIDCSVFPASRAHGGLPHFSEDVPTVIQRGGMFLKEFPLNTFSFAGRRFVFSGGGYFRLIPYALLRQLMLRSDYVMTYFHPRDFDADQPLIPGLSASRRFKSYYGLGACEGKLRSLLDEFEFVTVAEATRQVEWDLAPVVAL